MGAFIDLTGQKFGSLAVIEQAGVNRHCQAMWLCRCDCGKARVVTSNSLRSGNAQSCGCKRSATRLAKYDLRGQRFGRLTAVELAGKGANRNAVWKCVCDCGNTITTFSSSLRAGKTKSCGCLKIDTVVERSTKHSLATSRVYGIWQGVKERCLNKNSKSYRGYGARGISMCDEWMDFSNFYTWAMNNGYRDDLSIDRVDNDGNYCPENCRWATLKEQARNKRTTRMITFCEKTMSLADWSDAVGISYAVLHSRLRKGWSVEKTLTTPVNTRRQ